MFRRKRFWEIPKVFSFLERNKNFTFVQLFFGRIRNESNKNSKVEEIQRRTYFMQKIAEFLVKRRKLVLVFMIVLALISAVQIPKVGIITDMTHYLPDSSSMKQGMDIMEEEFNDMSIDNTIRVMFTDLKESEKDKLLDELSTIEYVASVSYESDSKEYNNGDYTLFILNIPYDYDTPEMDSVEAAVKKNYSDYEMIYNVDNPVVTSIPNWIIGVSMTIMLVIMLVMGESYIEPLLFLASIGVAVVINMGTNVLLGSVSSSTYSISSLLQMVLSIDYSIILMERYRQELREESDRQKAMTKAIHASFASIASSSITTVVGMLILCFMEFKIGMEMGTVLAKGVFISMICTLTVLPALILIFDKWIHKTAKHAPHFKMAFMGKFSFKARYAQTILFVLLFAVLSVTQGNTEMSYSMTLATEINEVFPKSNPIIIFYENEDEETITKLSEKWEQTEGVNAIMSYGTVLGKPYTVTHLANEIREMEIDMGDMEMDEDMLRLLYYNYYSNGNLPAMTIKEFVTFLTDEVMTNETFASEIDASMTENIDTMKKMTNAAELTKPMSIAEMAEFFDMGKEEVKQLYLLYFSNHGGVSTGKMTLPVFADFLVNEVANNPAYASMFTEEMKGQLQMILTFTDTEAIHAPMNYKQAAAVLGMDEESAKMLYVSYMAQSEEYIPEAMEIHTFISFICNDLANNPALSGAMAGSFDEATFAQLQNLLHLTDEAAITAQLPAAYLAQAFAMDEATVSGIMMMTGNTTGTMSMVEFVNVLMTPEMSANFDEATLQQLGMMQLMMNSTVNHVTYSYHDMAALLSMDAAQTKMLYTFYESGSKAEEWVMSVKTLVDFILANADTFSASMGAEAVGQLTLLQSIMNAADAGTEYTAKDMAVLLSMREAEVTPLYLLYISEHGNTSTWKVSAHKFVNFLVTDVMKNEQTAGAFDAKTSKQLKGVKKLIDASVSEKRYAAMFYKHKAH